MPKRRHEAAPMKRTDKEVDELLKTREDLVEKLRRLEETEVSVEKMEKTGTKVAERADAYRKCLLKVERMLDKEEVTYDEQDEEFEGGFEEAVKRPRVCIYQTGIEPLNRLVTDFVNSAPKSEPKYYALTVNVLHRMVRRIQKAGNCSVVDDVVPKDKRVYELWLTELVQEVNDYTRAYHLDMQTYLGFGFAGFDGELPEHVKGVIEDSGATKRLVDARKATASSMAKAISEAIESGEVPDGGVDGDDSGDAVGSAGSDDGRDGDEDELESLPDKKDLPSPSGSDISELAASACVKRIGLNGERAKSGDDEGNDDIEVLYDGPSPPAANGNEDTDSDIEFIEDVPPAEPKVHENVDAFTDSIEEVTVVDVQPNSKQAEDPGDVVDKAIVADMSPTDVANVEQRNGSKVD
ncbi:hypothetical protein AAVH_30189 [Aphelenchoides avenae]|nr:hypothetical protein AAVH_30189 [Aphelenchus avenae]